MRTIRQSTGQEPNMQRNTNGRVALQTHYVYDIAEKRMRQSITPS